MPRMHLIDSLAQRTPTYILSGCGLLEGGGKEAILMFGEGDDAAELGRMYLVERDNEGNSEVGEELLAYLIKLFPWQAAQIVKRLPEEDTEE